MNTPIQLNIQENISTLFQNAFQKPIQYILLLVGIAIVCIGKAKIRNTNNVREKHEKEAITICAIAIWGIILICTI